MIDYMQKGGPLMWLILFCSVVSVGVFAERLLYFHRATIDVGEFLQGLSNLIRKRNLAEARVECQATSVPVTRVIHAALIRHHLPRTELREIVQEAGQLEVPRLEHNLGMLIAIGYICPLIGLLGTSGGASGNRGSQYSLRVRCRISATKRLASPSYSKPMTMSSA
jgi:biopolymer transport protein ExbB